MASKKALVTGGLASLAAAAVIGVGVVGAANSTATGNTLADKMAAAFHLNKADVQKVIDQDRSDHRAQMEKDHKAKLDQAVKDGKITQAQEDQLIAKQTELRNFRESLKDKTEAERRAAMKDKLDEFRQWLTDNKIPVGLVGPRGHGGMGGPGMHHMGMQPDGDEPSPAN